MSFIRGEYESGCRAAGAFCFLVDPKPPPRHALHACTYANLAILDAAPGAPADAPVFPQRLRCYLPDQGKNVPCSGKNRSLRRLSVIIGFFSLVGAKNAGKLLFFRVNRERDGQTGAGAVASHAPGATVARSARGLAERQGRENGDEAAVMSRPRCPQH